MAVPGLNFEGDSSSSRERSLIVRTTIESKSSPAIVIPLRSEVICGVIVGALSPAWPVSGAVIFAVKVVVAPGLMTASGRVGCSMVHSDEVS